jgi:predicted nucleotidyltransferase
MKYHNIIEDLVSSKLKIALIKTLLSYPSKKFSGRELARLLKAAPSSTLKGLELFGKYGLLQKTKIGRTSEWALNQQHWLFNKLRPLLGLDEEAQQLLRQKIRSAFLKDDNIIRIVLFGSIAKKDESPQSDIDLCVEVKEVKQKKKVYLAINQLSAAFVPLFGNPISAIVYSTKELINKKNLPLIRHINDEGIVLLSHE